MFRYETVIAEVQSGGNPCWAAQFICSECRARPPGIARRGYNTGCGYVILETDFGSTDSRFVSFYAAGMVALKELGVMVDCYLASEINEEAVKVSTVRHDGVIQQLDDVRQITEQGVSNNFN